MLFKILVIAVAFLAVIQAQTPVSNNSTQPASSPSVAPNGTAAAQPASSPSVAPNGTAAAQPVSSPSVAPTGTAAAQPASSPITSAAPTGAPTEGPSPANDTLGTKPPGTGSANGTGSGSDAFGSLPADADDEAKYCHEALMDIAGKCPGLERFFEDETTQSQLDAVCPCLSEKKMEELAEEYFTVMLYCGTEIFTLVNIFSELLCAQKSNGAFCGLELANLNATLTAIEVAYSEIPAKYETITQAGLKESCTECNELFLLGGFIMIGDFIALAESGLCNEQCAHSAYEVGEMVVSLAMGGVLCIENNNKAQVDSGNPYCFPYVTSILKESGKNCPNKAEVECYRDDSCAWWEGKCYNLAQVPAHITGYVPMPPIDTLGQVCANSCYEMVGWASLGYASFLHEILSLGEHGHDHSEGRRKSAFSSKHAIRRTMRRKEVNEDDVPAEAVIEEAVYAVSVLAELTCLKNSDQFCLAIIGDILSSVPAGCETDVFSWYGADDKVTCNSTCAASIQTVVNRLGCCAATVGLLFDTLDQDHNELPNIDGLFAKCNVRNISSMCNPYASDPVPVTGVQVSGSCEWLAANSSNVEFLKNETAKSLGVSPKALNNFNPTDTNGKPCAKTNRKHSLRRTGRTLQNTAGLKVSFEVKARDAETAKRIATDASTSTKPIAIPSVAKATAETEKKVQNQQLASNVPTPKPTTNAPTPRPGNLTSGPRATIAPTKSSASNVVVKALFLCISLFFILF